QEYPGYNNQGINIFPNPLAEGTLSIRFEEALNSGSKIVIYNTQGALVKDLSCEVLAGEKTITWDGSGSDYKPCAPGLYYISANLNGRFYSARVIKQ
ncbi:MAG: T9SS C-terminal target domain-containing protein, partial [Flavobacteriia bacterium]|nr:T9SS C-terminal target domain-containing protein [Flavobacteriia bacterium]